MNPNDKMTLDEAIRYCAKWYMRIEFGVNPRTGTPSVSVYDSGVRSTWGGERDHVQLLIDLVTQLKAEEILILEANPV